MRGFFLLADERAILRSSADRLYSLTNVQNPLLENYSYAGQPPEQWNGSSPVKTSNQGDIDQWPHSYFPVSPEQYETQGSFQNPGKTDGAASLAPEHHLGDDSDSDARLGNTQTVCQSDVSFPINGKPTSEPANNESVPVVSSQCTCNVCLCVGQFRVPEAESLECIVERCTQAFTILPYELDWTRKYKRHYLSDCSTKVRGDHERQHFYQDGKYRCNETYCKSSFSRWDSLRRHCSAQHCTNARKYPCTVLGCKYGGENGFKRADKLGSHRKNVHAGKPVFTNTSRVTKLAPRGSQTKGGACIG